MASPSPDAASSDATTPPASVDVYRDTPVRFLGYANELGESFKPLIPRVAYFGPYGVACAYVAADASDVLVPRRSPPGVCFPGVVVSTEGRRVVDADDARREPVAEGRRFVMGVLGGTMSRARASLWTAAAARMHRSCAASTAASASSMLFRRASARF